MRWPARDPARRRLLQLPPDSASKPFGGAMAIGYAPAMSDIPILYSFRRCPYAMRARMALLVSGMDYAHREVLLRDKPAAMLAVSPKGTVPVLVLVDGTVVDESVDIMRWALSQHDPEDWLPRADEGLVAKFDGAFKHHLDRYKYAGRYDVDPLAHRAKGLAMLTELGERLAERGYLDGAERGFDDMALFPFVRQFAGVDADWFAVHAPSPVREWLAILTASDLFEQAMVRTAPWAEERN
jgi:glutathione S-transferase